MLNSPFLPLPKVCRYLRLRNARFAVLPIGKTMYLACRHEDAELEYLRWLVEHAAKAVVTETKRIVEYRCASGFTESDLFLFHFDNGVFKIGNAFL